MKKLIYIFLLLGFQWIYSQNDSRIQSLKNQLDILSTDNQGLTQQVKTDITVSNITLSNLLLAISNMHEININVSPELKQISLVNNFSNVSVSDVLIFLCKEYNLTIDFTGNILSVKPYNSPEVKVATSVIHVSYNPMESTISLDAKSDKLSEVFRYIMDESGKNLVFTPGMENKPINAYIKNMPFDIALQQLAISNNLLVEKTSDGFYAFQENNKEVSNGKPYINNFNNEDFKILDNYQQLLEVDFRNTPISSIINRVAEAFELNIFTASPLEEAGKITFKTNSITLDNLLTKLFESQKQTSINSSNNNLLNTPNGNSNLNETNSNQNRGNQYDFTFKKEGKTYYFGKENQLIVRSVEIIHLQHRSVELLTDPSGSNSGYMNMENRNYGSQNGYNSSYTSYNYTNQFDNRSGINRNNREPISTTGRSTFGNTNTKVEALLSVLPADVKQNLEIKVDFELNSFYVVGPSAKIQRFKSFIKQIDKPVPVILIEVMLIEVNRNSTIEAGVSWGLGEKEAKTIGNLYPQTNLTLGAQTINKVLNGFDGFGHINLGKVVPNFFATIKAMENNGNIKIRSTPKLSTLNGHRATFSNGQTSYYAITQRNIYGTDNPQTSEITNYEPIDAKLGLTIKPLVSGDGQVTLDIFVIQSSFGLRIADDAPPDLNSREFSSIIRVQDKDIVVLGGLEEQTKNDSGSGVPFLAKIPIIKWLFSTRIREDTKAKLTVLIKPTVIY
ncbi:type II secretion system protein GspD [Aestuariibaculum sediminum]|uniref:General secretion pathway protein GspD n=1 Tax=Aestuariibaculum sediminum TaxID=2770637 RepID=A0A8J6Q033_9FLAO|nr:general secretion pathway protein GspD [Aestuariibaculum sediminum]MBD0832823.1 general secretion pathway protein GspD [Aestuariibaculum sediminum]